MTTEAIIMWVLWGSLMFMIFCFSMAAYHAKEAQKHRDKAYAVRLKFITDMQELFKEKK